MNTIPDDPLPAVNTAKNPAFRRGTISFAGSGPNSRVSDIFISYADSSHLGKSSWESPVGFVSSGMDVVEVRESDSGERSELQRRGCPWLRWQSLRSSARRICSASLLYFTPCTTPSSFTPRHSSPSPPFMPPNTALALAFALASVSRATGTLAPSTRPDRTQTRSATEVRDFMQHRRIAPRQLSHYL